MEEGENKLSWADQVEEAGGVPEKVDPSNPFNLLLQVDEEGNPLVQPSVTQNSSAQRTVSPAQASAGGDVATSSSGEKPPVPATDGSKGARPKVLPATSAGKSGTSKFEGL